jgi:hypothetical protein
MKTKNSLKALAAGIVCAMTSFSGYAHDIKPFNLEESIQDSGLVFEGRVVEVENRVSTVQSEEHARLPHTFVTYAVDNVLKGEYNDDLITLRFIGGQDPETGDYLTVEGVPSFNLDDRDILFISPENGQVMCPLQGCEKGRFRVVGENLYSQHGREIILSDQGAIKFGELAPEKDLQRIWTHELPVEIVQQMSRKERTMMEQGELPLPDMIKQDDNGAPSDEKVDNEEKDAVVVPSVKRPIMKKNILTGRIKTPVLTQPLVTVDPKVLGRRLKSVELADVIHAKVAEIKSLKAEVEKLQPVMSVDTEKDFFIQMPKAVAPVNPQVMVKPPLLIKPGFRLPTFKPGLHRPTAIKAFDLSNADDAAEEEMVHRQGGNPVIK